MECFQETFDLHSDEYYIARVINVQNSNVWSDQVSSFANDLDSSDVLLTSYTNGVDRLRFIYGLSSCLFVLLLSLI
jgi:hypothetical protein